MGSGVYEFLRLAHEEIPTAPAKHNVTLDFQEEGMLEVTLMVDGLWYPFGVTPDEFDNPAELLRGLRAAIQEAQGG